MKIRDLLTDECDLEGCVIEIEQSLDDALEKINDAQTQVLIVLEKGRPVGMVTGRDMLRAYRKDRFRASSKTPIRDAMTDTFIAAAPDERVDAVMTRMERTDAEQIPVVDGDALIGLFSFRQLAGSRIAALEFELEQIKTYIADLHHAGQD